MSKQLIETAGREIGKRIDEIEELKQKVTKLEAENQQLKAMLETERANKHAANNVLTHCQCYILAVQEAAKLAEEAIAVYSQGIQREIESEEAE